MSPARLSLLPATAAGTLLCALWFVPSANATGDAPARTTPESTPSSQVTTQARAASETTSETTEATGTDIRLADTGSIDTTPYVIGGTLFLGVGAGFVVYSVRRERLGF